MKLDKTMLDRLLSLDDEALKKTINMLALTAGVDKESAKAATENLRLVRAKLSTATEEDINRAMSLINQNRSAANKPMGNTQNGNG